MIDKLEGILNLADERRLDNARRVKLPINIGDKYTGKVCLFTRGDGLLQVFTREEFKNISLPPYLPRDLSDTPALLSALEREGRFCTERTVDSQRRLTLPEGSPKKVTVLDPLDDRLLIYLGNKEEFRQYIQNLIISPAEVLPLYKG